MCDENAEVKGANNKTKIIEKKILCTCALNLQFNCWFLHLLFPCNNLTFAFGSVFIV